MNVAEKRKIHRERCNYNFFFNILFTLDVHLTDIKSPRSPQVRPQSHSFVCFLQTGNQS